MKASDGKPRQQISFPINPQWSNRDRFVLSAGHGSMLLYSLLHLTGYDLPLDQIKRFRQWGSITPAMKGSTLATASIFLQARFGGAKRHRRRLAKLARLEGGKAES